MSNLNYQPHLIREDFIDFVLEKFDPLWSFKKVKAKVVAKHALSLDMYQLHLLPNNKFNRQWQAGQSVLVTIQIDGIYHQRSYSIIDINNDGEIVLGIKVQGKVSHYLCHSQDIVVELSQAQGDFVLDPTADRALLIASGSGITAIYAMLKEALQKNLTQVWLLYFNRSPVFHVELESLLQQYPNFNYLFIDTSTVKKHINDNLLSLFCKDWHSTPTYVCGASAMMQSVKNIYQQKGSEQYLHTEYFQPIYSDEIIEQVVTFRRSQRDFIADKSLLESAEQAGLKPSHGCRMGICNTCTCQKVSGVTKNMLTGEIESEENRPIKLCISQAISPVVIDL